MDNQEPKGLLENLDPHAIDRIVETYGTRLLRAAFLLCGNREDAEDVVQDTFLAFAKTLHRFRQESSIYTWLYGIMRNISHNHRRKSARLIFTDSVPQNDTISQDQGQAMDAAINAAEW